MLRIQSLSASVNFSILKLLSEYIRNNVKTPEVLVRDVKICL